MISPALNIEVRDPLFLRAGTTPGFPAGGRSFSNPGPSLKNWTLELQVRGITGPLEPGVDFTYNSVTDVITLSDVNYITQPGEVWVITFQPRSIQPSVSGPIAVQYTNGFDILKVMGKLMNRIRWRRPTRSDFALNLTGNNVWGADDQFSPVFNSVHKVVDAYTVWKCQPDEAITEENFNQYLQDLQKDAAMKSLKKVFDEKEFLERKLLFERFGRQDYLNPNEGRFVGVRIKPARVYDKSIQIDSVALKFNDDVAFNLYLFHDTNTHAPIATFPVNAIGNEQTIVEIDQIISYAGSGQKSGVYYLGYFQDDLGSVQAINEIVERFNVMYNFGVVPIELPKVGGGIDVNQVSFTAKSHGFNIQLSAFRDFTQLILQSPHLFDNLIMWQVAADVIELINVNTRTGKDQRITADLTKMLYNDLNLAKSTDEAPFETGLKADIKKERARVKREFYPKEKIKAVRHDTDIMNVYGVLPDITATDGYY